MKKFWERGRKGLKLNKIASVSIFCILLIFVIIILFYRSLIISAKEIGKEAQEIYIEKDIEYLLATKESVDYSLSSKLKCISNSIERSILTEIDLEILEGQMDQGDIPAELEEIFAEHIKDKNLINLDGNYTHILICNNDGVVSDFSLSRATDENIDRTWAYEISLQFNKVMAKNTINNILDQDTDNLYVFEPYESELSDHTYYEKITKDDIANIYRKEGLLGLKNYYFAVPVYITEDGDIFGKRDIILGQKQKTNKLIIIQEYNLYDYILSNNLEVSLYSADKFKNMRDYSYLLYTFAIVMVMFIIIVIAFLCTLVNVLYERDQDISNTISGRTIKLGRREYDINPEQIIEMANKEKEEEEKK